MARFFFFLRLKCGSDCTHAFFPRDLPNRGPSPALVTDLAVVEKLFEKGMKKKKHSLELLFLTTVSSIGRLARLLLLPMIAFLFLSPVTNKKHIHTSRTVKLRSVVLSALSGVVGGSSSSFRHIAVKMLGWRWAHRGSAESFISSLVYAKGADARLSYSTSAVLRRKVKKSSSLKHRKHESQRAAPRRTKTPTMEGKETCASSGRPEMPSADRAAPSPSRTTFKTLPTRKSPRDTEQELLRYFGRARHHYDTVPLHKATAALQCAANTQANRVVYATLFPSLTLPSSPRLHAVSSSAERASGAPSSPVNSEARPSFSSAPLFSAAATAFAPTDLFVGYDHKLRQYSDWTMSRALGNRFSSAVDANKAFGARDVALQDVAQDIADLWTTLCTAWGAALQHCAAQTETLKAALPLRQSVCFVLNFAQTQWQSSVATSMYAVTQDAVARCRASRSSAPHIFAVVPINVGLRAPSSTSLLCDETSAPRLQCGSSVQGRSGSSVDYAFGGLYTFAAVVQCLSRIEPHTCTVPSREHAQERRSLALDAHLFIVSDAWLNPRNVADLFSGHPRNVRRADHTQSVPRADSSEGNAERGERCADAASPPPSPMSFFAESSRQRVHVFPGVVSDRLSAKERDAFGSFLWSMMMQHAGRGDDNEKDKRS